MSEESVQIYKSGQLVRMGGHLTDIVLSDDGSYEMCVMADGLAERVVVGRQFTLTLEDGVVVDGLEVRVGGSCSVNGTASLLKQVELAGVVCVYIGGQTAAIIGGNGDDTLVSQRDGVQFLFVDSWDRDTMQVGDGLDFTFRCAEGTQLSIDYDDFGARISCGGNSVAVMGVFEGIKERIAFGNPCNISC